jgi:hypothetical protein
MEIINYASFSLTLRIQLINEDLIYLKAKTQYFFITKTRWSVLFKEIIPVFPENCVKLINTLCGQNAELLITKADGTHSYHSTPFFSTIHPL